MLIDHVIEELAAAGVYLAVQDGKLLCKANEGALTPARRQLIAERKADFMEYFGRNTRERQEDAPPLKKRAAGPALLSPTQQRLWFIDQLTESTANYTIPAAYRLHGPLDAVSLERALQRVVDRHDILRTVIQRQDGDPVAVVNEQVHILLEVEALPAGDAPSQDRAIRARMHEAIATPFDLASEPPLRAQLLRLAPDDHVLLLTMHHIASDGWSVENLLRELSTLYAAFLEGEPDPLPPLSLQYADYAAWQRQWLQGERLRRSMDYWRNRLDGAPVVHSLPLDRPRPAHALHAGASWRQCLSPSLHAALAELGRREGATLFMTLLAAFTVFVARWSGESDIVIGTPVANRPHNELAPLIGFFSNTLALRTSAPADASFVEILRRTRTVALDAFEFQHLPFDMLVEHLNPPRNLALAPLVQLMFSLQDIDENAALDLRGIRIEAITPDAAHAKFDLNLGMLETPDGLQACWDYSSELFSAETIARMGASFEALLQGIVEAPQQRIDRLPLLGTAMQREMLALGRQEAMPHFDEHCLHRLFERQVARNPDAPAVSFDEQTLTYGELNRRANQLAHHLRTLGVGPDVPVALVMERGVSLVIGLMAILKAGGAYVPMDPAYPVERLAFMLEDSAPAALVTQRGLLDRLPPSALPTVLLDVPSAWMEGPDHDPDVSGLDPTHLAYVIYTSGSTGKPKGVAVEHGSASRLLASTETHFHFDASDVWTLFHSFAFDFSVWELWGALAYGGRLVVVPLSCARSPGDFYALLCREGVTVLNQTPSAFRALINAQDHATHRLRCIIFGGEALELRTLAPWVERNRLEHTRLINMYGITEITVHATFKEITAADIESDSGSLIGDALPDLGVYLLDAQRQLVPVGMTGEIYISGRGVARGYLNRDDLTASRFLPDPFQHDPQVRMYKSGDLGRWSGDGQLEYLGRNDFQVKIRGFRIELGEIEARLLACAGVREATVIARDESSGDKRLVAYVVMREGHELSAAALRAELSKGMADYMVPSAFVELPAFPLTTNGKLDRAALPAPDQASVASRQYEAPAGEVEVALAAMWQDLLGLERIGRNDNFFDLGGHSLLLTRLHNRLGSCYGTELALKQLFAAQTLREQAALIEPLQSQPVQATPAIPEPRPAGAGTVLSFAQRRLWFIEQMGNAGAVYNIPCALRIAGPLQSAALRQSLEAIVERHEVLRTPLVPMGSEAQPRRLDHFELLLPLHDFRDMQPEARDAAVLAHMDAEARRPFDLATDLFLRPQLLRLADEEHVLLLTLHHIAADGWSMAVLLQELATLYEAHIEDRTAPLPALPLQYADYAHWQQQWLQGDRLESQLRYWQDQLAALPVLHNLPLDFVRPDIQRYRGALHRQRLKGTLLVDLKRLAREHDATLFMALQTAFAVLLARWSGDTDIVMGTPIANRRHEALAPLIGFFVNSLVLRNDLSDNPTFADALVAARAMALDAYQHQDLPFEMLVDRLRPQRSLGHSPLFQVMLALENNASAIVPFGGLEVADMAGESQFAKFDLTLNLREIGDSLEADWDYNRDLFRADTIARFAASFEALLHDIVATPDKRIQQLSLLAEGERPQQVVRGPDLPLPAVAGVHVLIAAQASAAPGAVAVREGDRSIDYATLNRRANRVAHALRGLGVGPDARVAIHTERSIETVVGVLAVLKAGGAYVPLDPAHPIERLRGMASDSGAVAVLTHARLGEAWEDRGMAWLALDQEAPFASFADTDPVVEELAPEHLAYVIYTSGSTGAPKGAMIEHAALLNMVESCRPLVADEEAVSTAWWASFGSDVSVFEMMTTLVMGGTLHVVPEEVRADVPAYLQWLASHRITQAFLSPFIVRRLKDFPDQQIASLPLRRVLVGVEPLLESELCRIRRLLPALSLVNTYGPTETTFYCTSYADIRDVSSNAPIGRPIGNTSIHVLDDAMQPVPSGVVGEVYIAGACVGRGYLNQPDRTAERFLREASGARMYRSGDLARWNHEGQLEFRGRRDVQVKLNGVRIELGEIETALAAHPQVREAAVVLHSGDGLENRKLVAYVVSRSGDALASEGLRTHMAQRLPPYMLPAAYVSMQALPLTVNGKLDLRSLPAPQHDAYASAGHASPASPLEHQLAEIWRELLQLKQVSATDNFFDLGGHSLMAVSLMSRLREATGKALPISILFKAPTIRALAAQLETYVPAADESFVQLRSGGERAPLFVFHAAGGDVLCYQPLLQYLDPDMPVYGFHRSELPNQRVPALRSIEQLVHEYLPRLLKEQPEGPYYLAGWSSGGLLALEMAARLEQSGRTASVMLVDTMLATGTDLPARFHDAGLAALASLPPQAACDLMREFDPALPEVVPQDGLLPISAADYFNYLVAANQIGIDFHRPRFRLASRVHYFGCTLNQHVQTQEQRIDEIQALVRTPIVHDSFEATHFSIMEEPGAADLGRAMAAAIERWRHETPHPHPHSVAGPSPEAMA